MKKIGLLIILGILFIGDMWGQIGIYEVEFYITNIDVKTSISNDCGSYVEAKLHFEKGSDLSFFWQPVGDNENLPRVYKKSFLADRQLKSVWIKSQPSKWDGHLTGGKCKNREGYEGNVSISYGYTTCYSSQLFCKNFGFSGYRSILPKLKINPPGINNHLPSDDLITISSHTGFKYAEYNWQYATQKDSTWIPPSGFPSYRPGYWRYTYNWTNASQFNGSSSIRLKARDILMNAENYIGKNIYFRQIAYNEKSKSEAVTYQIIPSAPHILSVDSILETCYGTDDAQLIIKFDRALYPNEKVYFGEIEEGSDTLVLKGIKLEIDPITFKTNPITNISSGIHKIGVYGTYQHGPNQGDSINTYSVGTNHRRTVNIPKRQEVTFSLLQDPVHCYAGKDGKIKITALGGTGSYYAELYEQGKRGTLLRPPVTFSNSIYTFTNLPKGDYEVYLKDLNNCEPLSPDLTYQQVSVLEPTKPLRVFNKDNENYKEPIGFGYSDGKAWAYIDGGTGAYFITWKNSIGTTLKTDTLIRPTGDSYIKTELLNIPRGQYHLEVKDQNWALVNPAIDENNCGCGATMSFEVKEPPKLFVNIKEYHYVTCNGDNDGELVAHTTGGRPDHTKPMPYKYEWYRITSDSSTVLEDYYLVNPLTNDSILQRLSSHHYVVCVTDTNGIKATSSIFHLKQPDPLAVTTNITRHLLCDGYNIGEVEAVVTGGTPPYEYFWETGDTARVLSGLGKGIYSVFVRDARYKDNPNRYCSLEAFSEITSPNGMNITANLKAPTCSTYDDGEITLTITGGLTPYSFLWSDGATIQNRTNLAYGDYSIAITDANGCSLTDIYSLYEPEPLIVDIGKDVTLCKDRSVTLNGPIGQELITYLWTKDGNIVSTNSIFTVSEAGRYRLTVTNIDGCSAYDEITVKQSDDELSADFVVATEIPNNRKVYAVNITNTAYDRIEWIMPDEAAIEEQTEHQIYFSIPYNGHYSIGMIGHKGFCRDILYKTIEVKDVRDIDDYKDVEPLLKKFVVYPNPNDGNFKAEIELCEQMNYMLMLYDSKGKLIDSKNVRNTKGTTTQFNVSNKGSGVYLLRFMSQKMNSTFKVIIK